MLLIPALAIASANEWSGHVSGIVGLKTMDSSDWPELDSHFSMGLILDIKKDSWPVNMVLGIADTGDKHKHEGMEDLGHTTEYQLGIGKIFSHQGSKIQPYLGGGVSFIYAEQEFEENNDSTRRDDDVVGIWIGAGIYYEINPKLVLGVDLRFSDGEISLFEQDINAGGLHVGATAGYQF